MTPPETILGLKVATLISSGVAAVVSVALDWRSYDPITAVASVFAGMFVAVVGTELTLSLIGATDNPGSWGYAVAGVYGISGCNVIRWLKRASVDPPQLLKDLLGIKKGGGTNGE
jgi:hypothetical protein